VRYLHYYIICFWFTAGLLSVSTIVQANSTSIQFIENKCQWPDHIQFVATIQNSLFTLRKNGFGYTFLDQAQLDRRHLNHHLQEEEVPKVNGFIEMVRGHHVSTIFKGANPDARTIPFGINSTYYNFFLGDNPSNWSSRVGAYEGVLYEQYYPGIDLKVYSQGEQLKYEFILAAGAKPEQISFFYQGADEAKLVDGDLIVTASSFTFIEKKPVVYQVIDGSKIYLRCEYRLKDNQVSFNLLDEYDPCFPLVIDPILIFSTYSGSTADNWGSTATPGEHGTLYSAGVTSSFFGGLFPATPGAFQVSNGGLYDIGILKYDSTGSELIYATYLGGSDSESPHSLVVNGSNELLVLGTTGSSNFPTSDGAYDRTFNGGVPEGNVIDYDRGSDLFVAIISQDGSKLQASTYLGGSANDGLNPSTSPLVANYGDQLRGDIITDGVGNVYVSTVTSSSNFPVANSFGLTYNLGLTDALLIKLNENLSSIIWAAFIGGNNADASHTIKFDNDGNVVVAGGSASTNFPTTSTIYQPLHAGDVDGWIARIRSDGSEIINATFTGTANFNQIYFIDLDNDGNIYAYGQTEGNFPTTPGVYKNVNSGQFLQKFNSSLSQLIFSTVFGSGIGIPNISPTAFMVNDCNNIYLSGWGGRVNLESRFWPSTTAGMPVTADAIQTTTSGSDFYFIVLTSDATQLLYATYLGGTKSSTHVDGGTSRFDKSGIVYHAVCSGCRYYNTTNQPTSDFPTTPDAWSRVNRSLNCNNAAFKFDLSLLKARLQTNSIALNQPGLSNVCIPDEIVFQNKSTGGQYFVWDFGDGNQLKVFDTTRLVHQYQQPGTYLVKLKAVDLGTCIGADSTTARIIVNISSGYANQDQAICYGSSARLIAVGGVDYEWSSNGSLISRAPDPLVSPEEDTQYIVNIINKVGCEKKDTVNVRVTPGIDLEFRFSKHYDCNGRPTLELENISDTDQQVFFDFGDGATSDLVQVSHIYENDGTYPVKLVGIREACMYEEISDVPIYALVVPNVITPDEYPENNFFKIQYGGRPITESPLNASLVIYNRWGGLVYKSDLYQEDWNANNVQSGMYYYELIIENEATCKGWLNVIK